ncbi:MAG: YceI family protein [Candidatus Sulfotelmatobacter sp.]
MHATQPVIAPEDTKLRYSIEARESSLTIRAFATGMLSAFAHNPTIFAPGLEGEVRLEPERVEQSSLSALVYTASLTDTDDISQKDRDEINRRMQQEVLESDAFPEVRYDSLKCSGTKMAEGNYWLALDGEFTLHGVKRHQPISVRVAVNGDFLRATGEFSIRLSDYGIPPVTAVGGTIKLKDELKLSFDVVARKQE